MDRFLYHLNEKYQLLTPQEYARVQEIGSGGAIYREVLSWCMIEVRDAIQCGFIGEYTAVLFQNKIAAVCACFGNIYDMDSQLILSFRTHFIHFLSAVYLPLWAFFVAHQVFSSFGHWTSNVVGIVAVLLQAIFVIGIRLLAQVMQNPFGGELDLPVLMYIEEVCQQGSMRVLYSQKRTAADAAIERRLAGGREALGKPWKDGRLSGKEGESLFRVILYLIVCFGGRDSRAVR
jgi:predicted membrane chloride channel (bestrophin family)